MDNIKNKFRSIRNNIENKYAISKEGSNLSAIPDDIPEMHSCVISMCREIYVDEGLKETKKNKKQKINNELVSKEGSVLSNCSSTAPLVSKKGIYDVLTMYMIY